MTSRTPRGRAGRTGPTPELGRSFTGFGPDLVDFYDGLAADNSRAYWQARADVHDAQVRGPLEALASDLEPVFGEAKLFRPHRDLRFTPDKRPYQEHASMAVPRAAGTALYLQVGADELLVAAGLWAPTPDQLHRFRRAVDAGPPALELDDVLESAAAEGLRLSEGNPVKTAPRGYPRDHPRIELLRRRSLTVGRSWPPFQWWRSGGLRDRVVRAWTAAEPLNEWCARHVGPPDTAADDARAPRRPPARGVGRP